MINYCFPHTIRVMHPADIRQFNLLKPEPFTLLSSREHIIRFDGGPEFKQYRLRGGVSLPLPS